MTNMTKANLCDFRRQTISRIVRHAAIRSDIGQSFIELALVLPIFVLLLVGAGEFGRLAYYGIEVSNAARAGVAYGAQNHITASDNIGMQLAATNDGSNVVGLAATCPGSSVNGLCAVATQSCTCSNGTAITCANAGTTCISPARILEFVQVNTTALVDPLIYLPGLPRSYTLNGQAVMRVEQ
jgi:Flp pilus assembly protein TadG